MPPAGFPRAPAGRGRAGGFSDMAQKVSEVIRAELLGIKARRKEVFELTDPLAPNRPLDGDDEDRRQTEARVEALDEHLVGLSFSGGGIRSGTFAVGFLQGLASLRLLRRLDYLSTVSGGGYAGAWLAAWLKREGDVRNVEKQLDPSNVEQAQADREHLPPFVDREGRTRARVVDEEPEPLRHLREYSSYMTPLAGPLTADTWTVIAIWSRNVAINLMMLLPLAMLLVLATRMVVNWYGSISPGAIDGDEVRAWIARGFFLLGVVVLFVGFGANACALAEFRTGGRGGRSFGTGDPNKRWGFVQPRGFARFIVYPLILASVLLTVPIRAIIWRAGGGAEQTFGAPHRSGGLLASLLNFFSDYAARNLGLLGVPNLLLHMSVFGLAMALCALFVNARNRTLLKESGAVRWRFVGSAFLAGAAAGVLFPLLEQLIKALNDAGRPDLLATIVPPLTLLIPVAATAVEVALLGREITEAEREWWSRLSASLMLAALLWLAATATILYVPMAFLAAPGWGRAALASGWIGSTILGALSGRLARPSKPGGGGSPLAAIAALAPPIFLAGFLGAVSLLVAYLVNMPGLDSPIPSEPGAAVGLYMKGVAGATFPVMLGWFLVFAALADLARKFVDVNLFSLHAMYANRLIRCYLGASRPEPAWGRRWQGTHDPSQASGAPGLSAPLPPDRNPNPVTGFDPDDDIPLFDLRINGRRGADRDYPGPQLLINTTLNLVGGADLAWRDRKGESFVLTPLHCGSKGVGFAEVRDTSAANLTLGRAVAISGAAVDPNMKYYQSAPLTAFLTLFNARLGYWMQNPRFAGWKAEGPRGPRYLFDELLGRTDSEGPFVHLSDGGHFENLGVYELVRRRCRYIVALDAGEDTDASDDNLAELIRLCRIDFGIRIQLDTDPLVESGPDNLARSHVVVGRVRYDDVDNGQIPGILVYVKISMTGDEPSDVRQYAGQNPPFPHQPTDLRQSFDEAQFESYRALGDHIARDVFSAAARKVRDERMWEASLDFDRPRDRAGYIRGNQRLFAALRGRWAAMPSNQDANYARTSRRWTEIHDEIRESPALRELSRELYPELAALHDPFRGEQARAELHKVAEMLQVMEETWLDLGLKKHHDLPMDRGWLNAFRRWSGTEAFRRLWPTLRPELRPDFIEFCEDHLHLGTAGPPRSERLATARPAAGSFEADAIRVLAEEFRREWPDEARPRGWRPSRGIEEAVARAGALGTRMTLAKPPIWLLAQAPSGAVSVIDSTEKFSCGIVLVREYLDGKTAYGRVPGVFELFAWVRRPHRSMGLGSRCLNPILDQLKADLGSARPAGQELTLRVRYPKPARGDDGDLELGMWLNFFALFDFRPVVPPKDEEWGETILEYKF